MSERALAEREFEQGNPDTHAVDHDTWTGSFESIARGRAEWAAAHTPEAIAKREAEREKMIAEDRARAEARERDNLEVTVENYPYPVVRSVDINTATKAQLENIVDPATAARIMEERQKRPFSGWPDVVHRVLGLSAAETALRASLRGLTVNGQNLLTATP